MRRKEDNTELNESVYQAGNSKKAWVIILCGVGILLVFLISVLFILELKQAKIDAIKALHIDIPISSSKDTTIFDKPVVYDIDEDMISDMVIGYAYPDTNTRTLEFCDPKLIDITVEWYDTMFDVVDELIKIDSVGTDSIMAKYRIRYIKNGVIVGYRYPFERKK